MTTTQREILSAARYARAGMRDTAARVLSAAIRASCRRSDREVLMACASDLSLLGHPEFII